jgi:hypothetical protein
VLLQPVVSFWSVSDLKTVKHKTLHPDAKPAKSLFLFLKAAWGGGSKYQFYISIFKVFSKFLNG